jgi:SAM-dependent methyltransferase
MGAYMRFFSRAKPKRMAATIDSPLAADFAKLMAQQAQPSTPVNFQQQSEGAIDMAADYAVTVARNLVGNLTSLGIELTGKRFLELGPGPGFGSTLVMGESCAAVAVADRFLAGWQPQFHPRLYERMRQLIGRPSRLLDAVHTAGSYDGLIEMFDTPAHSMGQVASASYDVVISNAVLEHVGQLPLAARELFRITASGGHGYHQVDFRNHRDFELPLEHLLLSPADFQRVLDATNGEVGCQHRVRNVSQMFEAAGFVVSSVNVYLNASRDYLEHFEPRLRRSDSIYRDWPVEELGKIGAAIVMHKPKPADIQ